jgi:hypothetical protein
MSNHWHSCCCKGQRAGNASYIRGRCVCVTRKSSFVLITELAMLYSRKHFWRLSPVDVKVTFKLVQAVKIANTLDWCLKIRRYMLQNHFVLHKFRTAKWRAVLWLCNDRNNGHDKVARPDCAARGPHASGWPPNLQNSNICCRVFRTVFPSSDRRQYSGSQLRNLSVTKLIITGSPPPPHTHTNCLCHWLKGKRCCCYLQHVRMSACHTWPRGDDILNAAVSEVRTAVLMKFTVYWGKTPWEFMYIGIS